MLSYEDYVTSIDKRKVSNLYSKKVDIRKIKEYVLIGLSDAEISRIIGVHPNTLYNWKIQGAPFLRKEYELIRDGVVELRDIRPLGYNSGYTELYEVLTMSRLREEDIEIYLKELLEAARLGYTTKESRYVNGDYELRDISYGRDISIELDVLKSMISYKEKRSRDLIDREIKLAKIDLDRRAQDLAELKYSNRISDMEYKYELEKELYDKRAEIKRSLIEAGNSDIVEDLGDVIEALDYISSEGDE